MDKTFIQFLQTHADAIVNQWVEGTIASYPSQTARTLKNADPFANPVGTTLSGTLSELFSVLLQSPDPLSLEKAVEPIVRIRAIQTFNASEAIRFVFYLKKILRELLQKQGKTQLLPALAEFELFIDQTALSAFNIYTACKQTIYDLKAKRAEKQVSQLLKKAGFLAQADDDNDQSPDSTQCSGGTPKGTNA